MCSQVPLGIDEDVSFVPPPPSIVLITIPTISYHPTAITYREDIEEMNNEIRQFVADRKDGWLRQYNQVVELYDWQEAAQISDECSADDLDDRFGILTTALAQKFQLFMNQ